MLFHGDCEYLNSYLMVTESDIEPVKLFVKNTLLLYMKDHHVNKLQYELILNQIKVKDDPDTLWKILIGLSNYTYHLTHHSSDHFSALLYSIFNYDWKCEFKVSVAIIYLINQIVSTNATFLSRAFTLYVRSLLPSTPSVLTSQNDPDSKNSSSTGIGQQLQHRILIHKAIKSIIDQVPTGRSVLFPILSDFFPHKRFSCNVQTEYVEQLLHICTYEPTLQHRILELIIKKCLEMDVEIAIDDTGDVLIDTQDISDDPNEQLLLGNEAENTEEEGLFQLDVMEYSPAITKTAATHSVYNRSTMNNRGIIMKNLPAKPLTENNASRIPPEVAELADKLDSMLILVLSFFKSEIYISDHSDRLFQQLLSIFETVVLSVHKSKFVQFCIFYVASLNLSFAHSVTERLLSIVIGPENTQKYQQCSQLVVNSSSSIYKQSAMMYLSSYLSRAMFLSVEYVNGIVNRLLVWANHYVKNSNQSNNNNKKPTSLAFDEYGRIVTASAAAVHAESNLISKHELFYSVVQSICYILCFYGVEIAVKQSKQPESMKHWENIVLCVYDPLKYCLKSVRTEFLKLASCTGLFQDECWQRLPQDWLYSFEFQHQQAAIAGESYKNINADSIYDDAVNKKSIATTVDTTTLGTSGGTSNNHILDMIAIATPNNKQQNTPLYPLEEGKNHSHAVNKLDSFFPFDPCLLYKVHQTIQEHYRVWEGVPGLDEMMNSYDASSVDEEDEDDEESSAAYYDQSTGNGSESHHMNLSINERLRKEKREKGNNLFATSSLSSVVTSIAGTELGLSVNNSFHMSHSQTVGASVDRSVLLPEPSEDDEEEEDDEDDVHGEHMPIPTNYTISNLNATQLYQTEQIGNPSALSSIIANNNEEIQRYTGVRRPRFYSIGSTGSW